jgi:dTDP-4-dehydrorhamnose 3,5-epimerase
VKRIETSISGVLVLELEPVEDERGFFARTFCSEQFEGWGLVSRFPQSSISSNRRRGTLRGLHYQAEPYGETKLVRCARGSIYDVALDLRPGSETFGRWFATELSQTNHRMLYLARGIAHGFQALLDDSEVDYQIAPAYQAHSARGVRWDDPALNIPWPVRAPIVSERDRKWPSLSELGHEAGGP